MSEVEKLLQEHFVYEIKMLLETYRRCYAEVRTDSDDDKKILNNALIESFCVHARNLIEFFFRTKKFREFYAPNYDPFKRITKDEIEVIYDRLCGQISHLVHDKKGNRRASFQGDKIKAAERYKILEILRAEIINFKGLLAPAYAHIAPKIRVPLHPFDFPFSKRSRCNGNQFPVRDVRWLLRSFTAILTVFGHVFRSWVERKVDTAHPRLLAA